MAARRHRALRVPMVVCAMRFRGPGRRDSPRPSEPGSEPRYRLAVDRFSPSRPPAWSLFPPEWRLAGGLALTPRRCASLPSTRPSDGRHRSPGGVDGIRGPRRSSRGPAPDPRHGTAASPTALTATIDRMTSTRFWHGFADMHAVKDAEIVFRSGEGVWLESVDGRRFLDATAALWYCNVGFGRREIADAVAQQLTRLVAYSSFGAYTTEPTLALGRSTGRARPDRRCRRVLRLGRFGRGRHGREARPALLGRPGSAREARHRVARARLSRHARLGHGACGHPRQQGRLRRGDHRGSRQRRGE